MEVPYWDAQAHGIVYSESGAEETAISGRGGERGHHQGFQRLWLPPGDGEYLQILVSGDLGNQQQQAGVGEELGPGKDVLE